MATDYIENARKALEQGDFEEARHLEASHLVKLAELSLVVSNVFASHCRNKKYSQAVALGKAFQLSEQKIREAVDNYFSEMIIEGAFDRAIEWGTRNGLSKDELHGAAEKYCKTCLLKGEIEKGLEIKTDYSIPDGALKDVIRDAMGTLVRNKQHEAVLKLAEVCDVSAQLLFPVITGLLEQYAAADDREKLKSLVEKHKFVTEEFFGAMRLHEQMELAELVTAKIMKKYLYEDQFEFLLSFIEETEILSLAPQNPQLMKMQQITFSVLAEIHKTYFMRENIADAIKLAEDFHLMDSSVPKEFLESVTAVVKKFHGDLLKRGNIDGAIRVKDKYKLYKWDGLSDNIYLWDDPLLSFVEKSFTQLDVEGAERAIDEYHISKDQVESVVKRMLRGNMEEKNFRFVIELLKKFRLSSMDKDLVSMAENFFDDLMKESQFDVAADLGFYFNLKKKVTRKAALSAWEKNMKSGRLDEARELKHRHKLPLELTEVTARETYQYYLNINPETAKKIREEYQINLGFWELIIEILKKILGFLFASRRDATN